MKEKRHKEKEKEKDEWEFRWSPRPSIRFGQDSRIDFRLRYKRDHLTTEAGSTSDVGESQDLAWRRIGIEGRLAGRVTFQIERELSAIDPWRDVFVNYAELDVLQVQAGKFKLPFGLDENTSATNLDFAYRSLAATQLSPGRDRGVMVHGRAVGRMLRYEVGVFDHDGRNARTRNVERVFGGTTISGRITAQPFRSSKSPAADLQLGVAFTASDVPWGVQSLRGQTLLGESFFVYDQFVQGMRRRTGFELRWRPGPFSVKSEYIRVTTERAGQSVEDTDLSPLVAGAWYVSGTWALTGERKAAGLDAPRRPFLQGGPGAIELAMRIEKLTFGSAATGEIASDGPRADVVAGNADRAATFGVNWYLNRWVKLQWNAIHESIDDRARIGSARGPWTSVFRVQVGL